MPETLVWLGRVCEKKNMIEEARSLYQRAVDCPNCTFVEAYFLLGVICEKQKDYKKAILHLKTCLQLDKEHFLACLHYAIILSELRQYHEAVKYFKHARKLNPESISANFGYGKTLHFLAGNPEVAKEYYEFCIKKDPNHYKAFC